MIIKQNGNDTVGPHCSFCGKSADDVRKLVAGPSVFICDECVDLCSDVLSSSDNSSCGDASKFGTVKPSAIKRALDEYIIGQDRAKRILSVAVYNHYKRIYSSSLIGNDVEISKSNLLLIGPTGSGKTLLAKTLAKMLDVPFAVADATTLTESGYVGDDVETILTRLLQVAHFDVGRAKRGVVYVDEVDKIARKSDGPSITRDVSGEGVQQALLKIMEGTVSFVPTQGGRKHPQQEMVQLDTTDILFIFGGAFEGLDKVIESRRGGGTIGFGADIKKSEAERCGIVHSVEPEDLVKYGLIPEFVGRVPVIATLDQLSETDLRRIMLEPKNALLKQYKKLFELEGGSLEVDDPTIDAVVARAMKYRTGARGLRAIMEKILLEFMYNVPDADVVDKNVNVKYDMVKHVEGLAE